MKTLEFSLHEEGEEVLMYFRRHWITLVPWFAAGAALALLPIAFVFFKISNLPGEVLFLGLAFWYLFTFGILLRAFLFWFFNISILTNRRVVDIDYDGFLFHKISSAPLSEVQDITHDVHGPLELLFDFGDVYVQTASESAGEFDFKHVPNPEIVHRKISEEVDKIKKV